MNPTIRKQKSKKMILIKALGFIAASFKQNHKQEEHTFQYTLNSDSTQFFNMYHTPGHDIYLLVTGK